MPESKISGVLGVRKALRHLTTACGEAYLPSVPFALRTFSQRMKHPHGKNLKGVLFLINNKKHKVIEGTTPEIISFFICNNMVAIIKKIFRFYVNLTLHNIASKILTYLTF